MNPIKSMLKSMVNNDYLQNILLDQLDLFDADEVLVIIEYASQLLIYIQDDSILDELFQGMSIRNH